MSISSRTQWTKDEAEKQALENVAAEYSSNRRHINTRQHFIDGANWLAAYRDAQHASDMPATCQLGDSSAQFPEAEFNAWLKTAKPIDMSDYFMGGFERGRADRQWKVLVEQLRKRTFERDQLEARLADLQAEIERLKNGK